MEKRLSGLTGKKFGLHDCKFMIYCYKFVRHSQD